MIVIPMAGLSARFSTAGYTAPKYMLPLNGRPLFDHCVGSFAAQFRNEPFLFVLRDVVDTRRFVMERLTTLGISTSLVVTLDAPTCGQADTVAEGLRRAYVDPRTAITIFNIDTIRRGFAAPAIASDPQVAGYVEVFEGDGENWSFVRLDPEDARWIVETAEKRPISRLCCTGLYHFAGAGEFLEAFGAAIASDTLRGPKGEIYVAPLYNWLISRGRRVAASIVDRDAVIFSGVPSEYEALLDSAKSCPWPWEVPQPVNS